MAVGEVRNCFGGRFTGKAFFKKDLSRKAGDCAEGSINPQVAGLSQSGKGFVCTSN